VFVYGTLKAGFGNHSLLGASKLIGRGVIPGRLYVCGLPYFKNEGNSAVHGELYRVTDDVLARLDALEGHNEHNPETSFYKRITLSDCFTEYPAPGSDIGHTLLDDFYVYEYNRPIDTKYIKHDGVYNG
jgi:gamma-glutamylcyclotransferase (GGCT)/AIG2-like uncharacterized protein YtfP